VNGMKQGTATSLGEVTNAFLSYAILEMSTDATQGNDLAMRGSMFEEEPFSKASVISMVMPDSNAIGSSISLKSSFSQESLIAFSRVL
jgi:hypothetical protein